MSKDWLPFGFYIEDSKGFGPREDHFSERTQVIWASRRRTGHYNTDLGFWVLNYAAIPY